MILCGVLSVAYMMKDSFNVSPNYLPSAMATPVYTDTRDKENVRGCSNTFSESETPSIPCRNDSSVDGFKPNQIETVEKMMSYGFPPYMMLISPMQSGKTNTYLLYAYETLRRGIFDYATIFSGCSERKLYDQLKRDLYEARLKYAQFMFVCGYSPNYKHALQCAERLHSKIQIWWGPYLDRYDGMMMNTLFIWEEAHYAQGKGQIVDKFFKKLGLSATGDKYSFRQRGNSMISVSATPFSEILDNEKYNQEKVMVMATIGEGYKGVKQLADAGCIEYYNDNFTTELPRILDLHRRQNKYGLLRVTDESALILARQIAFARGWDVCECDLKTQNRHRHIEDLGLLAHAPPCATLILLIDKCRMGTVIHKVHIAFGMETSQDINADTFLQSLLGRFCGYDANLSVKMYLPHQIKEKDEIERFVSLYRDLTDGEIPNTMPTSGKNINPPKKTSASVSGVYRIIPIEFPELIPPEMLGESIMYWRNFIISRIPTFIDMLTNNQVQCLNNDAQKQEIVDKLQTYLDLTREGIESP